MRVGGVTSIRTGASQLTPTRVLWSGVVTGSDESRYVNSELGPEVAGCDRFSSLANFCVRVLT